jgi:NAD(P)-dependent dehydrogenase (short-subunit alcohol dehydrogenase family)
VLEVSAWKKKRRRETPLLSPLDYWQHPAGRVGEPGDIAAMAAFLISEASGFITGQNFVVDGGMTKKMIYSEG